MFIWPSGAQASQHILALILSIRTGKGINITSALSSKDASDILVKISCNIERVFNKNKDRQRRKLDNLLQAKQSSVSPTNTPCIDKNKSVINLSSRSLSDSEVSLL